MARDEKNRIFFKACLGLYIEYVKPSGRETLPLAVYLVHAVTIRLARLGLMKRNPPSSGIPYSGVSQAFPSR